MNNVITSERLPIKLWLDDLEEGALQQAVNLANLPFAFKHVAIMPDSHQGYGMPIGGVLATKDTIVPNAVGVDIGCGMFACPTNISADIDQETLKKVMGDIRRLVPVGFSSHPEDQPNEWLPTPSPETTGTLHNLYDKAKRQVGTLGGGNHFIEIQRDEDNFVWVMIHSGSRGVGFNTAKYYNNKAIEANERWFSDTPKDLSFFPNSESSYWDYYYDMCYCVGFALWNRKLMMHRVKEAFTNHLNNVQFGEPINKPHNYAELEHHFNTNVMIHRKGACRAREDELGMIPSSQGGLSYIVKGLGNEQSFKSCSHGAGRVMSRTKAKNELDFEAEKKRLEELGTLHALRNKSDLDEAPSSYKDMDVVMNNQRDLVTIKHTLTPIATIKG